MRPKPDKKIGRPKTTRRTSPRRSSEGAAGKSSDVVPGTPQPKRSKPSKSRQTPSKGLTRSGEERQRAVPWPPEDIDRLLDGMDQERKILRAVPGQGGGIQQKKRAAWVRISNYVNEKAIPQRDDKECKSKATYWTGECKGRFLRNANYLARSGETVLPDYMELTPLDIKTLRYMGRESVVDPSPVDDDEEMHERYMAEQNKLADEIFARASDSEGEDDKDEEERPAASAKTKTTKKTLDMRTVKGPPTKIKPTDSKHRSSSKRKSRDTSDESSGSEYKPTESAEESAAEELGAANVSVAYSDILLAADDDDDGSSEDDETQEDSRNITEEDSGVGRRSLMELSGGGSLVTKKGKVQAEREEVSKKTVKMKKLPPVPARPKGQRGTSAPPKAVASGSKTAQEVPPSDSDVSDDDEETQPPPPPHKTKNTTSNKKGTRHNEDQSVEHQPQSVTKPSKARSKSVVETSKKPAAKPAFTSVKGKRPQDSSEDSETPVEEGPKRPRQTKSMQGVAKQFREERSDLSVHNLYPVPGTSRSFFPGYHSREETPYMMPWGREGVHPAMWPPVPPPDYNQVGAARYYDERTPYQYYNMYGLREPRIHPRHGDTESVSSLCGPQVSRKASDAGQQSASATEKGDSTGTKAQEKESTDINQKASKANPEKQRERSLSPAESADAVELDSEETSSKIEKPKRSRSSHDPSRQNSPVRIRPGTSSQNTDKSSDPEIVFKKQQRNTSTPRKGPRVILPHSADLDDTLDDSTDIPPVISSGATTEPMSPIKQQQESVTLPAKKSILKRSETCTPHDPVVQQLVREAQEDMQENDVDKAQDEGGDVDNQVDQESVERPGPNEEVPNTSSQGPIPVANIVGLFSSKDCGLLAQTLATGLHKQNYYLEKLCEATTSGVQALQSIDGRLAAREARKAAAPPPPPRPTMCDFACNTPPLPSLVAVPGTSTVYHEPETPGGAAAIEILTVPETQSTIPETEEYREEPEEPSSQRADQQTGNDSDLEQQQAVTSSSQRVYFDLKNFQVVSKNLQETPPTNPPNLDTEHEPGTQGGDTEDVNNAADQDTLAILPLLHANPGTQTQEVYQRCLNAIDSALKVCESSSVDGAADPINDQSGENLFSQDAQNSQTSSDSDEQAAAEPSPPKSAVKKSRYGRVLKKSGK